ncbi:MAG: hypothetical protein PHV74_10110 [Dehalococcoidia bacterium]|nr:hypothetical protein [Dehalococcoidia bacterium]
MGRGRFWQGKWIHPGNELDAGESIGHGEQRWMIVGMKLHEDTQKLLRIAYIT